MQKRKIKPGSFQDRAKSKFRSRDKIDLKTLWDKDEEEIDPNVVSNAQIQNHQAH